MRPSNDRDRIINIAIGFGVACLVLICGFAAIGSYEISKIKESILVNAQNNKIDPEKLSKQVASLIKIPMPKNGVDGKNGLNGSNGLDSLSTHTITERQTNTVIEKELPPKNGENGKDGVDAPLIYLGISSNGKLLWKYENDRDWLLVPTIEVNV